jgi:small GTP-binding protein
MLTALLSERQAGILRSEREALHELLTLLAGWESQPKDLAVLRQALSQLDELFMLVVVGEFNAGKSALINALLGERHMPEGVTPTTEQIHVLRYGEKGLPQAMDDGRWISTYPAPFLKNLNIVDTPGTNAVLRQHEAIVRDFIPRSDLVLFVTSADRPFTESEREFLAAIRGWGKKVVLVINKVDILPTPDDVDQVTQFVAENASALLGHRPEIFPISARQALDAKTQENGVNGANRPVSAGDFHALETYLMETLNEESRIRLKLFNPLGVGEKIVGHYQTIATDRLALLSEDRQTLDMLERHLELYREDMNSEFRHHFAHVDNELLRMRARGEEFLDERLRIRRVLDLVNTQRMQEDYERIVVGDTPVKIEGHVQAMIDWMMQRELTQWKAMADQLTKRQRTEFLEDAAHGAAGGFAYNRRALLESLGKSTQEVVARYDRSKEARRLIVGVQDSLAKMAIVEVGAVGLGVLLKVVLVSTAADVSGLLAAGVVGVLGFAILPYKKRQAKAELRDKIEDLRQRLKRVLHEAFERELNSSVDRLRDSLAPYSRFVRAEHGQLQGVADKLAEVQTRLHTLRREIEA